MVSMVLDAVAGVCLGDAGSAAGPGQSSLVSMASVVAGGIRFAVPALNVEPPVSVYFEVFRLHSAGQSVLGFFFSFGVVRVVCFVPGRGMIKEERL